MGKDGRRPARVAERIREQLMDMILRGTVHDPAARDVIVSEVTVSADLGRATVYVRLLDPDASEQRRASAVDAMARASGFLRREMGQRLRLRRMPELIFRWDEGLDRANRIESLLDEVRRERPAEDGEGEGAEPPRGGRDES